MFCATPRGNCLFRPKTSSRRRAPNSNTSTSRRLIKLDHGSPSTQYILKCHTSSINWVCAHLNGPKSRKMSLFSGGRLARALWAGAASILTATQRVTRQGAYISTLCSGRTQIGERGELGHVPCVDARGAQNAGLDAAARAFLLVRQNRRALLSV